MMTEAGRLVAPKRGALIVFEGIDRSGKSSQATLLHERLVRDGVPTKLMRFPDRTTPIGQLINTALSGALQLPAQALHLLFAANRWEAQPQINQWLKEGFVLVLDRYSFSGIAYSTTAANMLAEKAAEKASQGFTPVPLTSGFAKMTEEGLPAPDRVYFLDIKPEETKGRQGFGCEVYETLDLQKSIYNAYASFRSLPFWKILPGSGLSQQEIHEAVVKDLGFLFKSKNAEEATAKTQTLWGLQGP